MCNAAFTTTRANKLCCSRACAEKRRYERDKTDPERRAARLAHYCAATAKRRQQAQGPLTDSQERKLRKMATYCALCLGTLGERGTPNAPSLDHIVPLKAGGAHSLANVRVVHVQCNQARPEDGTDLYK